MSQAFYCEKCNRTMDANNFYKSNNEEKYPEGKLHQCKKCVTMHVDNWNPDTYLWILQECDVPYIPDEWNKLLTTYSKEGKKITGLTIIGRYLSKMQLKQWKDFRWKDTEFLQEVANNKIEQTMKRQGFDAQQITTAIQKATFEVPDKPLEIPQYDDDIKNTNMASGTEDYFADQFNNIDDTLDLTDEERLELCLKWGKTYKPAEWVQLEKLYQEMMNSYDIQTAGHIDTLKLICKTSLKANQLIDIGDIEGYQKMSKVYNELMKAGAFTAAQNKNDGGEFVDSVGELVAICEREGFIPKFYVDEPNDKVDETIRDMQRYTRTLITEETNLTQLLEEAIKAVQKEDKEQQENNEEYDYDNEIEEIERELQESDYEEFNEFLENEEISDQSLNEFFERGDR